MNIESTDDFNSLFTSPESLENLNLTQYVKNIKFTDVEDKYKDLNISLQYEAYKNLLNLCTRNYPAEGQNKNEIYLEAFLQDMKPYLESSKLEKITEIWSNDFRVPQELIDYEYLMKVRA